MSSGTEQPRRPFMFMHGAVLMRAVLLGVAIAAAVVASGAPVAAGASVGDAASPTQAVAPTEEQIIAALAQVKSDPNLGRTRKTRTLRWTGDSESNSPAGPPRWLGWLRGLFQWIAESARLLLWVAGGLLAALLVLQIKRWLETHSGRYTVRSFTAPSHVRDLDIRPETLPDDIGAAARELWARGEHRAALALLYRGLLSRLAHVHAVPIKHSSTEGDCLILARKHLADSRSAYVSRLIQVWERAVYGALDPDTAEVEALCSDFGPRLDPPDPATGPGQPAAHTGAQPA